MISIKKLEGRDHFVVPTVMIKEGTFAGSAGPIHYPANVLRNSARLWNGKPIVVYHPTMFGGSFADNVAVYNQQKIGVIFNSRMDGTKLKADAWIDVQRVTDVDKRVLRAIKEMKPMEVSTGLVTECKLPTSNNSAPIVTAIMPDHLAILPDQIGACSMKDGAGMIVNELFRGHPAAYEMLIANRHVEEVLLMPSML